MFGNSAASSAPIALELPVCADWSLEQKLNGERDTLGRYLSGHPLDPYRDLLRQLAHGALDDLERLHGERKFQRGDAGNVVLAGLVTGLRKRVEALDGTLAVSSPGGGPTAVRAELPCGS